MEEAVEEAVMAAIQQQALSGQLPVVYVSKIEKHRKKGLDIFEAIEKADEEIREEQAAAAPLPEEGQMMAPEEAMGLAGPPQAMPPGAPWSMTRTAIVFLPVFRRPGGTGYLRTV